MAPPGRPRRPPRPRGPQFNVGDVDAKTRIHITALATVWRYRSKAQVIERCTKLGVDSLRDDDREYFCATVKRIRSEPKAP